jgi:hypothetical protein
MKRKIAMRRWAIVGTVTSLTMALSLSATVAGASSVPSPRNVRASGTSTSILVKWSRPTGVSVKSYVVTSRPSKRSCVTKSTSCYVKGLRPGVTYGFSVAAKTLSGSSAPSALSNHVRVATVGTYFLKTVDSAGVQISTYDTDYLNTGSKADLAKLSGAFSTLSKSLGLEAWPNAAKSDLTAFIANVKTLGTDTINDLNATASNVAEAVDALQTDTNKEVLNEAKVRTDLSLPQLIIAPIAKTPSPVALGASQTLHDFYGDAFSVTVTQVVDPATAASGSGLPDSGYRFVAVELGMVNTSDQEIGDDANFAMTVSGSDGQSYSADFGSVSQCPNFTDGTGFFDLPSGDSATGCVIFELPTSVSVQTISFSLAPGYLDTAEWSN